MILLNKNINIMIERRQPQRRQYITLNSRKKRHSSLPFILPVRRLCKIALLADREIVPILNYLSLVDLSRFQQALYSNPKTKEGAKTIISYIARNERIFSTFELKQFLQYIILRKRKLSKWWSYDKNSQRNDTERISWDVERINVWFCRTQGQILDMRGYLRRVLTRLCGQSSRYGYTQGFHCLIKSMYETKLTQQESYLLGSYFLKELRLGRYYQNRQERMRELCYVLDVYVYNNLPELHYYLKKQDLTAQCYAIGWFMTIFSQGFPLGVINRLWILFILKGWKVIIKFAVALLCLFQQQILQRPESQLPQFLGSLQLRLSYNKERVLWQLFCSIKVTNEMIAYLSDHMKSLQFDRQISIMQLKEMRDSNFNYGQLEANQSFPSYFSVGMCCEKVEPSGSFPYCTNG